MQLQMKPTKSNLCQVLILIASLYFPNITYAQNVSDELLETANSPIITLTTFSNFINAQSNQATAYSQNRLPDAVGSNNSSAIGTKNYNNNYNTFVNNSELYIKAASITDSGLKYGGIVELEANFSNNNLQKFRFNADKYFVFSESEIGRFEFGNNLAANQKMKVGPAMFARAAGGINGRYLQYINLPMLANSSQLSDPNNAACDGGVAIDSAGNKSNNCNNIKLPHFILVPQSPIGHGGYARSFYNLSSSNDYNANDNGSIADNSGSFNHNRKNNLVGSNNFGNFEDATKLSYYTPRINNIQTAFSFTANTKNSNTSATLSNNNNIKNIISFGSNYSNSFGNVGLALSTTGEFGQSENTNINDNQIIIQKNRLASYDVGAMLTYFGFTFGASYGYWGNSLQPTSGIYSCQYDSSKTLANQSCNSANQNVRKFPHASYYTAGIAYEFGPIATSITTLHSQFQKNKYQATSLGIDYKLKRGVMPYLEITNFRFKSYQPSASNITNQSSLSNNNRQLKDNSGYVAMIGILLAF